MKDVREWDETDLQRVVEADQKETTTLDYKASAALSFKDRTQMSNGKGTVGEKHRQDLIRDVASMANAEGGLIIYGIKERSGGYPDEVDDGADPKTVSAEQIEQIILTNINPRLEGFVVHRIDLKLKGNGTCAFVISISKAHRNAPHQADDKLYYRRHDATKLVMEDNEIRDMIGRSLEFGKKFGIAWDLLIEIRRIVAAATARQQSRAISGGIPGKDLIITVSSSLRSSGVAVMSLPQPLRIKAARLINTVDQYNSLVELSDGQHVLAGAAQFVALLGQLTQDGEEICAGLEDVLKDQP
ncbi:ATP-binding protein [Bradyrhizobium sp. SZCCHNR1070]|uniref:AlbA family DNA-binding domain-containing protein n=1 Tax=Bradyrhizobium sp. SZCCHNR1070 TaxID=3057361 RepID=UPI0029166D4B|nr:ATP-binding protein [Bradyrhizobium sp. SZCCHNR1070]